MMEIDIDNLTVTKDVSTEDVSSYEEKIQSGEFEPIEVEYYPVLTFTVEQRIRVVDGHHRLQAAKNLGMKQVPTRRV